MTSRRLLFLAIMLGLPGCDRTPAPAATDSLPAEPSPPFRNVETATAYAGDEACMPCHEEPASAYRTGAMVRSFHRRTDGRRIEGALDEPLFHAPTGFYYSIVEEGDDLYQEEYLIGPRGRRLHELRRRMDYVMGSGTVARTYFTEENGRLFQLPLTWYRDQGWDFSPGYELNNARFDRLMPNQCIACHSSYPDPAPFLEGKYARLPPGIGCERCHGPGALHVSERSAGSEPESTYDNTIVNPRHLPIERRLDVCEQCHVHAPVTVLREGEDTFSYLPSQPLSNHAAFFKTAGNIDIVSHADRLRQSACFVATRPTGNPLECATCHDPHVPAHDRGDQNQSCRTCHAPGALQERLGSSASRSDHGATANCVACHMPKVKERTIPHGSFTDHWIRVTASSSTPAPAHRASDSPVEPYYERDRIGPHAEIYQGMGEVVYATRANNVQLLRDAAETLEEALKGDSLRADAHFILALAFRQLGRTDDAIRALERSISIAPDRPERLHALARAYERAGRDAVSTARLYERALELQPALAWIRADYADFLQARGRLAEAEEAYGAALSERPSLDVAAFNLGTLLTGQGRLSEASAAFRKAVRLDPSLAEALAPLLHVRTSGNRIAAVRSLGSPLGTLPVRYRGPNAVQLRVNTRSAEPAVGFADVPLGSSVRILEPDGTLVRSFAAHEDRMVLWDLLTAAGEPISSGLYHVRVQAQDASNRSVRPQRFSIGVVRVRSP